MLPARERNGKPAAARDGGPLIIGSRVFDKGLGGHAPADIGYALGGHCRYFSAAIGIDEEVRAGGSVVFEVWGDGARLYQSAVLTGADEPVEIGVDVSGVQELRLVVTDDGGSGSDHADWGDAELM